MGLQGVALATLIAASIAQLGILLPYLGRTFGLGQVAFLWTMLSPHVPAAVAALVVGWGFRQRDISDYAELIVAGLAIGGSYLAVLMLARANRSELRLALAYLRGR
jgi:hypothetical protein